MQEKDTICALATSPGEGAIGIIRISGDQALSILQNVSNRKRFKPRYLHFIQLVNPASGELLDEVLACYMPAPHSFTGEDVVEINGHGGLLNLERIITILLQMGARIAQPGEFSRRAFLNGKLDLTQAEALAQVISAKSDIALRNARSILRGKLGHSLNNLKNEIIKLSSILEAQIDFADDIGAENCFTTLIRDYIQIEQSLQKLAASYKIGKRLNGAVVGLTGPVNAGKSSVFNLLLGKKRALVADEPGTTRDYIEAEWFFYNYRLTLLDTAGYHLKSDEQTLLEAQGRAIADPILQKCDLLLNIVDISASNPLQQIQEFYVPVIIVANKVDLVSPEKMANFKNRISKFVVTTSAISGEGIEDLKQCIIKELFPDGETEIVQVTAKRQWHALIRASEALLNGRLALERQMPPEIVVEHNREALHALEEITGEIYSEAVLDEVFKNFCIGK